MQGSLEVVRCSLGSPNEVEPYYLKDPIGLLEKYLFLASLWLSSHDTVEGVEKIQLSYNTTTFCLEKQKVEYNAFVGNCKKI